MTGSLCWGSALSTSRIRHCSLLDEARTELEEIEEWDDETILESLRKLADRMEIKLRDLAGVFYVAITGRQAAPPLTASMEILGKRLSLERLSIAIERLQS